MDELYAFLFGGLLIILGLFVFFGGNYDYSIGPGEGGDIEKPELSWRVVELGDISLKEQKMQKIKKLSDEFEVHNGVLSGNSKYIVQFELEPEIIESEEESFLNFFIKDTNNYGDLNIRLNNQTLLESSALRGEYRIPIDVREENKLEVEVDSSGWKIWAPSIYIISNTTTETLYSFKETPEEEFFLSEYLYKNLHKCELVFDLVEANDLLEISINDKEEYSEVPYTKTNVLELTNIEEGKNKISFFSEGDVVLENVIIRIFYYQK